MMITNVVEDDDEDHDGRDVEKKNNDESENCLLFTPFLH